MSSLEVLFTPADFGALSQRDLSQTCCVVFDVLRATSTMVTALWNGAEAILPVQEIADALAARERLGGPVLLAGERAGVRIGPDRSGGTTFDLGNSPGEFTADVVRGKIIVMTTTNGTRALRACLNAQRTFAACFLNLTATAEAIRLAGNPPLLLVCSGTVEQAAYEDILGAGALCDELWPRYQESPVADSAQVAREIYLHARSDLAQALARSRNGRRLLSHPTLHGDVSFCARRDALPLVAELGRDGLVRRQR
ncbi:MAG TPA: 2-phosphosulfolactate phosphatase [Verrucomicrobiae bacterium]|nr:2-phosphosulfolactate phosphatase [Verrucomicrobiae bacterium]